MRDNAHMILGIIFGAGLASVMGLYALANIEERSDLYSKQTMSKLIFTAIFFSVILGNFLIDIFGSLNLFELLGG
jgi:hypothetical protein